MENIYASYGLLSCFFVIVCFDDYGIAIQCTKAHHTFESILKPTRTFLQCKGIYKEIMLKFDFKT